MDVSGNRHSLLAGEKVSGHPMAQRPHSHDMSSHTHTRSKRTQDTDRSAAGGTKTGNDPLVGQQSTLRPNNNTLRKRREKGPQGPTWNHLQDRDAGIGYSLCKREKIKLQLYVPVQSICKASTRNWSRGCSWRAGANVARARKTQVLLFTFWGYSSSVTREFITVF